MFLKLNSYQSNLSLQCITAVLVSYLDLHVEVSLLALLSLLCLHPFLLLQTLHQLLGDVHVGHWLEHLAWDTQRDAGENYRVDSVIHNNICVYYSH